ncbi:type VII secretion protein EccE [Yinghuangia seranimata]|uniref:type VII secretion protein EccE n=1 Tax=Yinghuangia seranimata TaxID=408067 RepID=UPI00248C8200|nr:type VII secretion protein EccE [Yinghuangia seranimata]MDI2132465.1 type VII secretion protein EccE [Yinghuangia seranimata]
MQHLVALQLAALLIAVPLATKKFLVVPGGVLAVVILIGVWVPFHGRRLALWPGIVADFRKRQRPAPPEPDEASGSADLAPIRTCVPGLALEAAYDRTHGTVGMVGDGTFLTSVLLVEAPDEPLRPRRAGHPLPLAAVASALSVDGIVVGSAQVVLHSRPAPAPHLPAEAMAARAYQELSQRDNLNVPAVRQTWVAVRLDPSRCTTAIAARGGGYEGAQRTLLRAVNQLTAALAANGLTARPLDEQGLVQALIASCGINRAAQPGRARTAARIAESRHAWRCDDRWHATYWVSRWPKLTAAGSPDVIASLTGAPGIATTFALTAHMGGGGSLAVQGHVRVSARSSDELEAAARHLEARGRHAGLSLVRLDFEQQPGLLATIPLGGGA